MEDTDRIRDPAHRAVILSDPQPGWPLAFAVIAAELASALPAFSAEIEHIGSTAVPGLCAKPVIDVMAGVRTLVGFMAQAPALVRLGYAYRPEYEDRLPDRRYFVRPPADGLPRVHLHVLPHGGAHWRRHLLFRDRLRSDASLAAAYAALKRRCAEHHANNKAAYTAAKAPFITAVLIGEP